MAAVAQRLAAVVMPFTFSLSLYFVPAPMNPIPAIMPAATCADCASQLRRHQSEEIRSETNEHVRS